MAGEMIDKKDENIMCLEEELSKVRNHANKVIREMNHDFNKMAKLAGDLRNCIEDIEEILYKENLGNKDVEICKNKIAKALHKHHHETSH